jgi:hypothetical protein
MLKPVSVTHVLKGRLTAVCVSLEGDENQDGRIDLFVGSFRLPIYIDRKECQPDYVNLRSKAEALLDRLVHISGNANGGMAFQVAEIHDLEGAF